MKKDEGYIKLSQEESGSFQAYLSVEHLTIEQERLNLTNATVCMKLQDMDTKEPYELKCDIITGYVPLTTDLYNTFLKDIREHKKEIITDGEIQLINLIASDGVVNVCYDSNLTLVSRKLEGYFRIIYEDGRRISVPSGGDFIEVRVCEA